MSLIAPETKRDLLWLRINWGILLFLGVADLLLQLFIIPKFQQIYADALPGKPLPGLTLFIITARWVMAAISLGWPILSYALISARKPTAFIWINLGIVFLTLQMIVTVFALCLPMMSGTVGMSNAP